MRLKILFFPLMLAVSAVIFIGYVWPEIANLKTANREKAAAAKLLDDVMEKQDAINSIAAQISGDSESAALVNGYLPDKKVEERIIGAVNYLAGDSGISLVSISLENKASDATEQGQTGLAAAVNSSVEMMATGEIPADSQAVAGAANAVESSTASIAIVGDYAKIRLFLDQLQRMSLLNHISSLSIAKPSENPSDTEGESSTDLSAEVVVDFGYFKSAAVGVGRIAQLQPKLDKDIIETLKQYVSQKTSPIAAAGSDTGSKGRINPFLP